ncbi:MAG: TRAP transporter small permease [Desulfobacteraceae bacterium]|nr:MAG: TRAP transporter small permease [Desulfobacteraceae bacterium]
MMLKRIEKVNRAVSVWFERIGIVAMLLMVAVTCIDVIGTKCFAAPFLGAIDIVTLSQVVAIAFTIAIAQISGRHISVELLVSSLSERSQAVIESLIGFLQTLFFAVIVWRIFMLGRALSMAGEVSSTLFVPLYPFLFAIAIGFVPITVMCLLNSFQSATRAVRR